MKYFFIFSVLFLTSCASTEKKESCLTHIIDNERKVLLATIPHGCSAHVSFVKTNDTVKKELSDIDININEIMNNEKK